MLQGSLLTLHWGGLFGRFACQASSSREVYSLSYHTILVVCLHTTTPSLHLVPGKSLASRRTFSYHFFFSPGCGHRKNTSAVRGLRHGQAKPRKTHDCNTKITYLVTQRRKPNRMCELKKI